MLAKYDHAGKATSDGGTLYGARDKNFADAVAVVIKNDPPSSVSDAGVIGGFKVVTSDMHQVIYGADDKGLCKCARAFFSFCHVIVNRGLRFAILASLAVSLSVD